MDQQRGGIGERNGLIVGLGTFGCPPSRHQGFAELIGRRSGKQFSLGDRVEVEILQVSVARRRIELRLRDGSSQKGDRSQRQDRKDDRKDDRKGKPKVRAPKKADRNERRQKIRNQNTKRPKARR